LRAIEQILYELELYKVCASSQKLIRENNAENNLVPRVYSAFKMAAEGGCVKKNLLRRKQTPPTNAFNWVLKLLSQSVQGSITVNLLVFCDTLKAPKVERIFSVARFSLKLITLAK